MEVSNSYARRESSPQHSAEGPLQGKKIDPVENGLAFSPLIEIPTFCVKSRIKRADPFEIQTGLFSGISQEILSLFCKLVWGTQTPPVSSSLIEDYDQDCIHVILLADIRAGMPRVGGIWPVYPDGHGARVKSDHFGSFSGYFVGACDSSQADHSIPTKYSFRT